MSRRSEDLITQRVRAALGTAYDPKAEYVVLRPGMLATPKYAGCKKVGEFEEDSRHGGTLIVAVRPPKPPPKPSVVEKVRSAIASAKSK